MVDNFRASLARIIIERIIESLNIRVTNQIRRSDKNDQSIISWPPIITVLLRVMEVCYTYLLSRIAADILSICLLPIMAYSLPPQQELCESVYAFVLIRSDYKYRCYVMWSQPQFKIRKNSKDQIFYNQLVKKVE